MPQPGLCIGVGAFSHHWFILSRYICDPEARGRTRLRMCEGRVVRVGSIGTSTSSRKGSIAIKRNADHRRPSRRLVRRKRSCNAERESLVLSGSRSFFPLPRAAFHHISSLTSTPEGTLESRCESGHA